MHSSIQPPLRGLAVSLFLRSKHISSTFIGALALLVFGLGGTPKPVLAVWPHDPYAGSVSLCTAAGDQQHQTVVSDNAGGAIIAWADYRSGNWHIYAQRIDAAGAVQWTPNGVALCTATGDQDYPTIAADGTGGAIVTWHDSRNASTNSDIYAQRVNSEGVPQWTSDGVALCTAVDGQGYPTIAPDGAGGAIITWFDYRSGVSYDIYAQRVDSAGAPQWTPDGVVLCATLEHQEYPSIVSDGAGGAIVTWWDYRGGGGNCDIYAQMVNASGVPQWTASGVALCTETGDQNCLTIVSDGAGGAIVTWRDGRGGSFDIYAQKVNVMGVPQWTANGVALCTATGTQDLPTIAADGTGGAIITWHDSRSVSTYDIYAQRVAGSGTPQWTSNGVALCTAANSQGYPTIFSDAAGGAIVTWFEYRSGTYSDVYAQRVNGAGVPQWTSDGVAICVAIGQQEYPILASDGMGGAIIAWQDSRLGNSDIYAQRVERFGRLGNPEPTVASVRDVPYDQGGHMKVSWSSSYLDDFADLGIGSYWVWRSVPPNLAAKAMTDGTVLLSDENMDTPKEPGRRYLIRETTADKTIYWEYLGSSPATADPGYSYVVPTLSDSMAGVNPPTLVRVQARAATGSAFWSSLPDSGYSVDNLPPGAPTFLASRHSADATRVRWRPNAEPDLAQYRLYRGTSAGFVPDAGNLVTAQADTGYVDSGASLYSWYKLTAVDVHGNESVVAILSPQQITDVPGAAITQMRLYPNHPNPFNPRTTIRFDLPAAGPVRLAVYDVAGRLVRVLVEGEQPAGSHGAVWDGRDATGRAAPSGSYLARLVAGGKVEGVRLSLVR